MKWLRIDNKAHTNERVRSICYGCGSPTMKHTWSYLRVSDKFCKNVLAEVLEDGTAFYYVAISKTHARLIGIAVKDSKQRKGLGKMVLFRLLSQLKNIGLNKLTLRTSSHEEAQFFWLAVGAVITGYDPKSEDYEMEIIFK